MTVITFLEIIILATNKCVRPRNDHLFIPLEFTVHPERDVAPL